MSDLYDPGFDEPDYSETFDRDDSRDRPDCGCIQDHRGACDEECECECDLDPRDEVDFDPECSGSIQFADPGGNSALRAATRDNPRNLPCPDCGEPDRLTPADVRKGYCCDACADANERGGP